MIAHAKFSLGACMLIVTSYMSNHYSYIQLISFPSAESHLCKHRLSAATELFSYVLTTETKAYLDIYMHASIYSKLN